MNVKSLIGLATVTFMIAACQSNTYHIKGEAKGFKEGTSLCLSAGLTDRKTIDTLYITNGRFSYEGATDSVYLCRLCPVGAHQEEEILFFLEPGNIYIELSQEASHSRVSGTKVNNEWQALNDRVTASDHEIRRIMAQAKDSISTRKLYDDMERIYTGLTADIKKTALRNKDNALGHFISHHFNMNTQQIR